MVKNGVKDWLGINSDSETYIAKKDVRAILAKELEVIFEEAVTGKDNSQNPFSFLSKNKGNMLIGRIKSYVHEEAVRVAELYVNGLEADVLRKVNSEEFLDGIVKRINNKQVG